MTRWTTADIPDQSGRTAIVTGANSGLGRSTATALASAGAHVIVACRDTDRDRAAAAGMPGDTEVRRLDLASLGSVREFADGVDDPVDVLINNAGVMAVPFRRTADGFELQFGTNHLGHFALTGLLLDRITDRVIALSSGAHRMGRIDFGDLNWERRRYRRWAAYGQSKLADLMFAYEFAARALAAGSPLRAMAAHPGYAATNLQSHTETAQDKVLAMLNVAVGQSAAAGALPTLYAATVPDLVSGWYIGPDGPGEWRGYPTPVGSSRASHDRAVQRRLWEESERLTGVRIAFDG